VVLLIVDDHPTNRKLLRAQLEGEGHSVFDASDGVEALHVLEGKPVDAVISDILMPDMDGFQLCLEIRKRDKFGSLPFILYTSTYDSPGDRELAKSVGADQYIIKPAPTQVIIEAVNEASRRARAPFSRKLSEQDETYVLKQYSAALVRKLEDKNLELGQSEERFRQMAEQIRDAFFLIDLKTGAILYVSPAYEEIWGRSCNSLYADARSWSDAIHPDDRDRVNKMYGEQHTTGRFDSEYRIVRPDGAVRWIHARTYPIRDESGSLYRSAGIAEDTTERRRAAEELRESERRFSDMLGKVELVSLMLDKEARITYCNDYLLGLTGWRREEVLGRDWFKLFIPPDLDEMKKVFSDLIADLPEAWHHENEILTRAGARRAIRWNNSVLRSISGEVIGTASIGEDITEQKQAEIRIRSLNRVYAVLSGINTLIVRVRDRQELFDEVCRIAVEDGNFGMAWIGEFDRITLEVRPIAWKGIDEGATLMKASAREDIPEGQGMVGRAIRGKKPVITNDISADPGAGGPRRDEALRKGLHSIIAMPLMVEGEIAATLTLFAKERNFFSGDEMKLLTELAGDISFALDHLAKAKQLAYVAYYDTLTALPNRTLFLERLSQALHTAAQSSSRLALTIGDVKRFRQINETLGRQAGDELLKQIAVRLPKNMRNPENLARVAGDSFATFLPDIRDLSVVAHLVENLHDQATQRPFTVEGQELMVSLTIGIAVYPDDGADAETLFRNAEAALKKAKASGEPFLFYEPSINARVADSLKLENKLHRAIEAEQFVLHYQPKVDSTSGSIASVEALIRWQDPETGLVPPGQFIPLLEETGMILEVGLWAIRKALSDHGRWRAAGVRAPRVAVNVSAIQLQQKDFVDIVTSIIDENRASNGAPGGGLDLEITESLIMKNIGEIIPRLKALRESGVDIMVDDFGTGHSSLGYLARLPITALKIDRSFVDSMSKNPESMTIVSTIISLAHSLNLKVIAEGVETEDQAKLLRLLKCDELQGYLLGRPAPFDSVTVLLPKAN
jgi:diguanylate cyclase (GGDEF)-like protein/PAS domain S-box-containing protein